MEQNVDTHQFAAPETEDSTSSSESCGSGGGGDDSENSSVIIQQISVTATTTSAPTVPANRGTLQFFPPRFFEAFLIDAKRVYIWHSCRSFRA